jgi:hypothetical protein
MSMDVAIEDEILLLLEFLDHLLGMVDSGVTLLGRIGPLPV